MSVKVQLHVWLPYDSIEYKWELYKECLDRMFPPHSNSDCNMKLSSTFTVLVLLASVVVVSAQFRFPGGSKYALI